MRDPDEPVSSNPLAATFERLRRSNATVSRIKLLNAAAELPTSEAARKILVREAEELLRSDALPAGGKESVVHAASLLRDDAIDDVLRRQLLSENTDVQRAAARALARRGDASGVAVLVVSDDERDLAALARVDIEDPVVVRQLVLDLSATRGDPEAWGAAPVWRALALGRTGDDDAFRFAAALIDDGRGGTFSNNPPDVVAGHMLELPPLSEAGRRALRIVLDELPERSKSHEILSGLLVFEDSPRSARKGVDAETLRESDAAAERALDELVERVEAEPDMPALVAGNAFVDAMARLAPGAGTSLAACERAFARLARLTHVDRATLLTQIAVGLARLSPDRLVAQVARAKGAAPTKLALDLAVAAARVRSGKVNPYYGAGDFGADPPDLEPDYGDDTRLDFQMEGEPVTPSRKSSPSPVRRMESAGGGGRPPTDPNVVTGEVLDEMEDAADEAETSGEETGSEPSAPPTRRAYPVADCAPAQVMNAEFALTVGIAAKRVTGVGGAGFRLPDEDAPGYDLDVLVRAPGFSIADGESWSFPLHVTPADPWPTKELHLTPLADPEFGERRDVEVIYGKDGHVLGVGTRSVHVFPTAADVNEEVTYEIGDAGGIEVPTDERAPDLTITIGYEPGDAHGLRFSLTSPWPGVEQLGANESYVRGPDAAAAWHLLMIRKINKQEGNPMLAWELRGAGAAISDLIPAGVWTALQRVAERARATRGERPSVLLLTQEWSIPWELAVVPDPLLDAAAPPFLGAQVAIGRWIYGTEPARPQPGPRPAGTWAVVSGDYAQTPGWNPLDAAVDEAEKLVDAYDAESVEAKQWDVHRLLLRDPAVDVLHFAVHGSYDPKSGLRDGIVLIDNELMDTNWVRGRELKGAPFVFLNACQVGAGQEILGQPGGVAAAFLKSGASAVVAPLWSVADTTARKIALAFYVEVFEGTPVAEAIRAARASIAMPADDAGPDTAFSGTHLAYQFFGHPHYVLTRGGKATPPAVLDGDQP